MDVRDSRPAEPLSWLGQQSKENSSICNSSRGFFRVFIGAVAFACCTAVGSAAAMPFNDPIPQYESLFNKAPDAKLKGLPSPARVTRSESELWASRSATILWWRLHPEAYQRMRSYARVGGVYESPRKRVWATVSRCECNQGSGWDCNTGNGYYGGLQMDLGFQGSYGPEFLREWGTANNWPAWAQMKAADRAYENRGLQPWPVCGHRRLGFRPVP